MNQKPFISIIIATFNIMGDIEELIASLNGQKFADYEVLISDGGSTDGCIKYFNKEFVRNLTWSKSCKDGGIYYALNEGLKVANGEWIIMLGADDRFVNNDSLLDLHKALLKLDWSCNMVYTDLQIKSKTGIRFKLYPEYPVFKKMYKGLPPIHHQTIIVKSECIKGYGGFNTKYRIHADYELFSRIISDQRPKKLDLFVIMYSDAGYSSRWNNIWRSIKEIAEIRKKYNKGQIGLKIFLPHIRIIANKILNIRSLLKLDR